MSLIIDIHGYAVSMPELYSAKAHIFGERGWGLGVAGVEAQVIERCARWNVQFLDEVGTDLQLIGPRPYLTSFARQPMKLVRSWMDLYNRVTAEQCDLYPSRLRGIAGLPQASGAPPSAWVEGLAETVAQGFVGVVINPDPGEGDGATPGLGDPYWYPVWEALTALDLPALIVSGVTQTEREGYSSHYITEASIAALSLIENPQVFEAFPALRLIIGYGGGSIPYQIDRWRARRWRQPQMEDFDTSLRRLHFDTVVYSPAALDMLLDVCGVDRCLFGSQRPGAGSVTDPRTGRHVDDVKPKIEGLARLTAADRDAVFELNARRVFPRLDAHLRSLAADAAAQPRMTSAGAP